MVKILRIVINLKSGSSLGLLVIIGQICKGKRIFVMRSDSKLIHVIIGFIETEVHTLWHTVE